MALKTYKFPLYRATRFAPNHDKWGTSSGVFFLKDTDNCFSDERHNSSLIR
ncbi:hypothetical protein Krac_9727 [Ktedonobacter racemifer DSM 44963]|uniref:Uncharacterized protein n=1 Tax=Ktedonobacter racemifer DSM 44963 TaxID=485913 RepID=D6TDF5_KTERA|nr:hypothetical protein Krac_9727 [Ktedonobacter racemifer DSM 44963]